MASTLQHNLLSLASNIASLKSIISDSLLAAFEKGVFVPSGSRSIDLPGLIRSINPETLSVLPVPSDLTISGNFIAEGRAVGVNYVCDIFNNNGGVKGVLVETIQCSDWKRLAQYSPNIVIALNNVCNGWLMFTPFMYSLDFLRLSAVGNNFMYNCSSFNHPISFPSLISTGSDFLGNCSSFINSLEFPSLTTAGIGFLKNKGSGYFELSGNITFSKFVVSNSMNELLRGAKHLIYEFREVQNLTNRPAQSLDNSTLVDLRLRSGSSGVNVSTRT